MKVKVLGFPRTIYNLKDSHEPEEFKNKFLDPWSSLQPKFLRQKICNEIVGLFKINESKKLILECFLKTDGKTIDSNQVKNSWALVFPKRSYLPEKYPHFQLWNLSERFAPCLSFLKDDDFLALTKVTSLLYKLFKKYSKQVEGDFAFGYNSTPFSFIKDEEGRYYAGGQSVRVFHSHYLHMLPESQMNEITIDKKDLGLVSATDFSKLLFKMFLGKSKFKKNLFGGFNVKFDERGIELEYPVDKVSENTFKKLWNLFYEIDRVMYKLQIALIHAFYEDGNKFISSLNEFITIDDVSQVEKALGDLILVGSERDLGEAKEILRRNLFRISHYYGTIISGKEFEDLEKTLTIDLQGDICSYVEKEKVVLRPGMGYGVFAKKKNKKFIIRIAPLDVIGSKGLMEAAGYWFEKKNEVDHIPDWLKTFTLYLSPYCLRKDIKYQKVNFWGLFDKIIK